MSELIADLFISMDGFASGVDQPAFFGFDGPDLADWIRENIERPQTILMGRKTYEALSQFSAEATDELSLRMTTVPKIVFSSRLEEPLTWKNTRILRGPLAAEIKALKQQAGDPLRCIGSVSLVRSLVDLGVLDRLRLMIFPVILGSLGREPIFQNYPRTNFQLLRSTPLDSRITLLEYRPLNLPHSAGPFGA